MPYMCTAYTVDYIGVTRTVGVVWACRRLDYIAISVAVSVSPFWLVAVLTISIE